MSEQNKGDQPPELDSEARSNQKDQPKPAEYGGPKGKEPTRYGDWEKKGRCIDF